MTFGNQARVGQPSFGKSLSYSSTPVRFRPWWRSVVGGGAVVGIVKHPFVPSFAVPIYRTSRIPPGRSVARDRCGVANIETRLAKRANPLISGGRSERAPRG